MTTSDYQSGGQSTGTFTDTSSDTSGAKEQAKQAAGTAADEGKHVAGVAKDEAQNVAAEAKAQARNVVAEARTQIEDQSRTQRDRLVETLRTFGDDLEQMALRSGRPGMASDLARQVADKTRTLGSQLDGREPYDIVEDIRSFARRKPGAFLLGALVAGVAAGRVTRGAKEAASANTAGGSGSGVGVYGGPAYATTPSTATGQPTAGTGYPVNPAVPSTTLGTTGVVTPEADVRDPYADDLGATSDPITGATPATGDWAADDAGRRGTL